MKIERIDVTALKIPRKRAPMLGGRRTDDWSAHVLVDMVTDTGHRGTGEARLHRQWSYETLESAATTLRNYLAPELIGVRVDDFAAVHGAMEAAIAPNIARGQPIAKSAVDMACCDLLARLAGQPLVDWLGGEAPAAVRTNALLSPKTPAEAERMAAESSERGFRSFKLNLGQGERTDLEMAAAVKQVAGERYVLAEANQGYDYETALAVGRGLEKLGIDAYEQPLRANRIAELRSLKDKLGILVQLDESIFGPDDLQAFLALDAVEAVTLKVSKAGGITPAVETVRLAREAGLKLAGSGLAEAGVGLAASAAFFSSIGLIDNLTLNGPQLLVEDIIEDSIFGADGAVTIPAAPGLGVTLNQDAIDRYRVEI